MKIDAYKDMRIDVYKDLHVEGLALRKIDPVSADGNIALLLNSEDGFSAAEVAAAVERFFMCPICGSSIVVEAEYKSESDAPPKIMLAGVIDGAVPVYILERTVGYVRYQWRCSADSDRWCVAEVWCAILPPKLKPASC